ncbi:riboflavin synthase [bacterium]|nr:MAG: riboflavin synthase [bacterium]
MFTGLIQGMGVIESMEKFHSGKKLVICWDGFINTRLKQGSSVAVDGVCLSIEKLAGNMAYFTAVEETIQRTTFKYRNLGELVNIELPITPETFMDGHIVQGHIDCIGEIVTLEKLGAQHILKINYDSKFSRYIVPKGSIAVDGISLTVARSSKSSFSCAIIPDTLKRTTLSQKKSGDYVNIEFDVLAKYVEKQLSNSNSSNYEDDFVATY